MWSNFLHHACKKCKECKKQLVSKYLWRKEVAQYARTETRNTQGSAETQGSSKAPGTPQGSAETQGSSKAPGTPQGSAETQDGSSQEVR